MRTNYYQSTHHGLATLHLEKCKYFTLEFSGKIKSYSNYFVVILHIWFIQRRENDSKKTILK
jgi:hypothetical protein